MPVLAIHTEPARQPSSHKPLVVLHGLFGSWENWGARMRALAETRDVIGMDLRNHGNSPHCPTMSYAEMIRDVLQTLDDLSINQVAMLGHSMGGKVAMGLASQAPHRIEKLIVVDIAPRQYAPHHEAIIAAMNQLQPEQLSSRTQADQQLAEAVPETAIRAFLLKNLKRLDGGGYGWRLGLEAITRCYDSLLEAPPRSLKITQPVLLLHGSESDYVSPDQDKALLDNWFEDCHLISIDGAGHWPHASHPDVVQQQLDQFLD